MVVVILVSGVPPGIRGNSDAFVAAIALAMADRRSARIQDWQWSVKPCVDAARAA